MITNRLGGLKDSLETRGVTPQRQFPCEHLSECVYMHILHQLCLINQQYVGHVNNLN